jgi:soluble lytic murein transglycosylase
MIICRLIVILLSLSYLSTGFADQNYLSRFIDYMTWDQQLPNPPTPAFIAFVQQNTPLAKKLREKWLYELAQRQDWAHYVEYYQPSSDVSLQCYAAFALYQQGQTQLAITQSNQQWLSGESKPPACDKLFTFLFNEKIYTQAMLNTRLSLALEQQNFQLAEYLYKKIRPEASKGHNWLERVQKNPSQISQLSEHNSLSSALYLYGLKRLLRPSPDLAIKLWHQAQQNQLLSYEQNQTFILYTALYKAAHDQAEAEQWFAQLDKAHQTDQVLEWKIRFALKRQEWTIVQQLISRLSNQDVLCWQYWLARALDAQGHHQRAVSIYQKIAHNRQYYGFLASDRLKQPFQFDHEESVKDSTQILAIYKPVIKRITTLYQSQQGASASRLTNDFASELPKSEKSAFIHWLAHELHWYGKSVYLSNDEALNNQLTLRFPLAYLDVVQHQANEYHIPMALIYAVIRQESAFRSEVISSAGAHGLMQLMPATARWIASIHHIPFRDKSQLFQSPHNIHLGTAYLSQLAKSYHNHPLLMVAAYNAGPKQVNHWLRSYPLEHADIWIEVIPYYETRNYLKNVIAFYQVYQHRLQQPTNLDYFMHAYSQE